MLQGKSIILSTVFIVFTVSTIFAQTSNLTIKPYGYFKFDMAYDQARTNNGNYVFWVESSEDKDSEINLTARQTRLGVNFIYDELNNRTVSGKFEIDFYGGGTENKNMIMMRHGYLKVDFGKYYLLAGQTSDVLSPLVPNTVNYTVLWNCGNIGYRHPQIQFGNSVKNGVEIIGALSRNIAESVEGEVNNVKVDKNDNDDGEDSSLPSVQARISYINPNMNVGISGHYGLMEYTRADFKEDNYTSFSLNFHVSYAFTNAFLIKGEVFTGKTLDQYFGGIGQGFDWDLEKEVESSGGWLNAALKASPNISCNLGIGIDQPEKDDPLDFPTRNYNRCVFGNIYTKIAYNTSFALEISNWETGYYNGDGDETHTSNLRLHTALILNF